MKTKMLILTEVILIIMALFLSSRVIDYSSIRNVLISKISSKPYCKNCNVILISLDTLSANHLPCYGYARNTAPNLCAFAGDNIIFKNAFANSSWTLPSHTSIFTGLYPSQHKVNNPNKDSLSQTIPFLPEILQKNNYQVNFYMRPGPPLPIDRVYNRGIDAVYGTSEHPEYLSKGLDLLLRNTNNNQKTFLFLHTNWVHSPYFLEDKNRKLYAEGDKTFSSLPESNEVLFSCSDKFMSFLEKKLKKDLENNYWDSQKHLIYQEIYQKITSSKNGGALNNKSICDNPKDFDNLQSYMAGSYVDFVDTHDTAQMAHLVNLYDSKIKELDEYLKSILSFVLNSKLKENTIIIVTSDHGEEFMEHSEFTHGNNLYDTTIKVPLMMYVPGQKNREITQLAQGVDIFPTLLNILGIQNNYKTSGINLFSKSDQSNRYTIAQQLSFGDTSYVIRDNRWKLHYKMPKGEIAPLELYDMSKDSEEKNNVIFLNNDIVENFLKIIHENK